MNHKRGLLYLSFSIVTIFLWLSDVYANNLDSLEIAMVLWRGETDAEKGFVDGFRGDPVKFTIYDCRQNTDELINVRSKLLSSPPDLIYAFGTTVTATLAGKIDQIYKDQHITATPIVFSVVADPQGAGLLRKFSTISNRNITGVSHLVPMEVQLNAIASVIPLKSIGVVYNPEEANSRMQVKELNNLSITHSVTVVSVELQHDARDSLSDSILLSTLSSILKKRVDVLYLPSDSYIISNAEKIVNACQQAHIPTFSATEQPVRDNGACMGLVCKYYSVGLFAAYKARQILTGTEPGSIPCEKVPQYSLLINMQACKSMELYPPVKMLRFAEIVTSAVADSLAMKN
jgi:putative ABC transport system substrate-binding protein